MERANKQGQAEGTKNNLNKQNKQKKPSQFNANQTNTNETNQNKPFFLLFLPGLCSLMNVVRVVVWHWTVEATLHSGRMRMTD